MNEIEETNFHGECDVKKIVKYHTGSLKFSLMVRRHSSASKLLQQNFT
jgi:hypothetical protein